MVSDDANAAESFTSGAACGTLRQGESPAANDVVIEWGVRGERGVKGYLRIFEVENQNVGRLHL